MTDRRTMRGWFEYLDDSKRELTLSEFMAQMLLHLREYARQSSGCLEEMHQAAEHVEGMLGAIDELCSRMDPAYKADGQVRAALDRQRDEQRKLAAAARSNGGGA